MTFADTRPLVQPVRTSYGSHVIQELAKNGLFQTNTSLGKDWCPEWDSSGQGKLIFAFSWEILSGLDITLGCYGRLPFGDLSGWAVVGCLTSKSLYNSLVSRIGLCSTFSLWERERKFVLSLESSGAAEIQTHPWSNHEKGDWWDELYLGMTELPNSLRNRVVIHWVWSETVHSPWSEMDILDKFHRFDLWVVEMGKAMTWKRRQMHKTPSACQNLVLHKHFLSLWFVTVRIPVLCRWFCVRTSVRWFNGVLSSHLAFQSI